MSGNKTNQKSPVWMSIAASLLLVLLLIAAPGKTESRNSDRQNQLPQSPDTGSPESDFSAGGTRGEETASDICNLDQEELVYLLGTENREFTLSSHPTFWFYFPQSVGQEIPMTFAVKEAETNKTMYTQTIKENVKPGIVGIALPVQQSYALSPETDYDWSLAIDCQNDDRQSDILLTGKLQHQPADSHMKAKLAAVPASQRHQIYLEQNLLYDAVTELAQARINRPQSFQVKTDWQHLLSELGWQNLRALGAINEPRILDTNVSSIGKANK